MRKLSPCLVAFLLLASACGSTAESEAATTTTESETSPVEEPATTTTVHAGVGANVLAFTEDWVTDTPVADGIEPTEGQAPTGGNSPTEGGSGSSTNTTSPPRPNGIPAAYTGMLGTLGIDDILFAAPADAPVIAPGTAPLTGLAGTPPSRRAVVVKIDNSSKARPQLGLNAADVVFEEQVEGGITRLAAVFHTNQATVGPVRSGRTTDISFINAFGGAALAYSGANQVIDTLLLRQTTIENRSAARVGGYWRDSSRRAPSNMFTETSSHSGGGASPPAQFAYGTPSGGTATSAITVSFPASTANWSWTGSAWARSQNGTAHTTDGGAQVTAANVVVAVVPEVLTGLRDTSGGQVPEYIFAGSGPVSVFTNGQRIDGTWTRPTLRSPAILVDGNGAVIELTPGRTWVELVVAGSFSSS